MPNEVLAKETSSETNWYEDEIEIRGCQLNLGQIKSAFRELEALTRAEGDRIVAKLAKPSDISEADLITRNEGIKRRAFRVTVSIIGFDGRTNYGDTEEIFDSKNLPTPIRTVYFTNTSAWNQEAPGTEPPNRFSIWLNFNKPPLFDPNPLVSEPTLNGSKAHVKADEIGFFRAVQNIVSSRIKPRKKFYSFIHEKFAYDIGLWFIALPLALYWVTFYMDHLFPTDGSNTSYRIPFFIYALGLSLLLYRSLTGYLKWAFPVNILEENRDHSWAHRVFLGALVFSIAVSSVKSILGTFFGL